MTTVISFIRGIALNQAQQIHWEVQIAARVWRTSYLHRCV